MKAPFAKSTTSSRNVLQTSKENKHKFPVSPSNRIKKTSRTPSGSKGKISLNENIKYAFFRKHFY